ncbi:MAG: glucose-1-phosphate thymidylyltransferase, partial [Bacteroidetes bacterium]|nr:glucose-1-phosphate thymidylyltransferase [Bacteroidota bacterium]
MNYILIDDHTWKRLLPLTFTKPVSEIRMGILTVREKWDKYLNTRCSYITEPYLTSKYTLTREDENVLINSSILPNHSIIEDIAALNTGEALIKGDTFIAVRLKDDQLVDESYFNLTEFKVISTDREFLKINYPWDIFSLNGEALGDDFALLTSGRTSAKLNRTNNILGEENLFAEEGVNADFVTINATKGPVYIGKEAEIMEGSLIRGPFALCEHSTLKSGAKIYGPTTIGPHCKVGGEVNNSVIFGYSNKAHDGFLGNSVLGEWCNIGAGTNNSNLKNNYAGVRLWNYEDETFI